MKRVLLALTLAALCAAPASAGSKVDAPPDGIAPTTVTIAQILKHYDEATGTLSAGLSDTRSEQRAFTNAGLSGTETLIRSGRDYYARITRGPLTEEYGQFLNRGWHRDENGVVSPMTGEDYSSFVRLLLMRRFDDASDPKSDLKLLGEVSDPAPAYVIEVKRSGNKHPEWMYCDKISGLIDRVTAVDSILANDHEL